MMKYQEPKLDINIKRDILSQNVRGVAMPNCRPSVKCTIWPVKYAVLPEDQIKK